MGEPGLDFSVNSCGLARNLKLVAIYSIDATASFGCVSSTPKLCFLPTAAYNLEPSIILAEG